MNGLSFKFKLMFSTTGRESVNITLQCKRYNANNKANNNATNTDNA